MDEIDIDDFNLRDEDLIDSQAEIKSQSEDQGASQMEVDVADDIRPNVLCVQGVDDLSTKDVQKYMVTYLPEEDFRIEWVNDSTVCVVFTTDESADKALNLLTSEAVYYDGDSYKPTQFRDAKTHPEKRTARLLVRMALMTDKKSKQSREKSRYYLVNGEPTFEDERFRFTHGTDSKRSTSEKQKAAEQYGYKPAPVDEDDLFPNKALEAENSSSSHSSRRRQRDDDNDDLFPGMLENRRGGGGTGGRRRSRSPGRDQRSRGAADFASRLAPPDRWVKGEALDERLGRDKKGRRRAADMF